MRIKCVVIALASLITMAACKDKKDEPTIVGGSSGAGGSDRSGASGSGMTAAISDREIKDLSLELLDLISEISTAVKGKDCAGGAAGINAVLDRKQDFLDRAAKVRADKSSQLRAEKIFTDTAQLALEGEAMELDAATEKCEADPAFNAATKRLKPAFFYM